MIAVPAWVWRFPSAVRAMLVGVAMGVVLGLLSFFGSNSVLAGVVVLVVISLLQAVLAGRRMAKSWPQAKNLDGADRVAATRAARRGIAVTDPGIARAVVDYSRALRDAHRRHRFYRWTIAALGIAALAVAILDTLTAPGREAAVSWLYFAFFPVEAIWWPRRQAGLLANAAQAQAAAQQLLANQASTA